MPKVSRGVLGYDSGFTEGSGHGSGGGFGYSYGYAKGYSDVEPPGYKVLDAQSK
jgi:hypothetical protein